MRKKPSLIWSYYEKQEGNSRFVTCLLCSKTYTNCGNTTNLLNHLRSAHKEEVAEATDVGVSDNANPDESQETEIEEQSEMNEDQEEVITPFTDGDGSFPNDRKLSKRRSVIWNYFEKRGNSNQAVCLLCDKEINTSGNTTNMLNHFKRRHGDVFVTADKPERISAKNGDEVSTECVFSMGEGETSMEHVNVGDSVEDNLNEFIVIDVKKAPKRANTTLKPKLIAQKQVKPQFGWDKNNLIYRRKLALKENYYKTKLGLLKKKVELIEKSVEAQERIATALENLCS